MSKILTPDQEQDRKFLHDLATPVTIARQMIIRVRNELKEKSDGPARQKLIARLESALKQLDDIVTIHAAHKALLSEREEG
jgi:hypothetical protein